MIARLNTMIDSCRRNAALPEHCPLCRHQRTGERMSLTDDPWHWLTCRKLIKGELSRRHDAVADAVGRVAWQVGAQVRKEVEGLDLGSKQRPDLEIVLPGRVLLTDVLVSHSLTTSAVAENRSQAMHWQRPKDRKYAGVASRLGAELLNVSVDACGGLAEGARLAKAVAEEGERWSAETWGSASIERYLLHAIAVAVQKGNTMAVLVGYTRTTQANRAGHVAVESSGV